MGVPDPEQDGQFYAGVPLRRFVAFLIDSVVIVGIWFVVVFIGFLLTVLTMGAGLVVAMLLFACSGFLYRWLMLRNRSATLGMIMTGIEVRDHEGEHLDDTSAALHTAGYYVTVMFPPLMLIGWILLATSPYRRAMHDTFMGTVVINRPE
ncbi:MAG: RDD family protein [Pseudomonadota bacterium]